MSKARHASKRAFLRLLKESATLKIEFSLNGLEEKYFFFTR